MELLSFPLVKLLLLFKLKLGFFSEDFKFGFLLALLEIIFIPADGVPKGFVL